MDEDQSTDQPVVQTADEVAPVVDTPDVESPSSEPTTEPSAEAEASTESVAPEVDKQLQSFAASQGIELDSPNAIKAAQALQKARSEATKQHQKASELEKATAAISDEHAENVAVQTGQDPELLKRLQRVEIKETVRDFWNSPLPNGQLPDRSLEQDMIKELAEKPYLAGDIKTLYASATFNAGTDQVKSQAKQEVLQKLAHNQQATVPKGHATNSSATPAKKDFNDMSIAEMEAHLGKVRQ